jgi:O-antigen/teichoic acid export membrane protein
LILGAVITVGFSYLFVVDDFRVQVVITISLTALVALLLLLEFQLETPFQGVSDIKPTAMEFVLQEIDAITPERSAQP